MHSLQKIPTRLRGTKFCTSLALFPQSFVRQPNGPECTQMVLNAPKRQFRVQWVGLGAFIAKNSDATSCMNFCTSSACFAPSFVRQPNGSECTQMVRNAPKTSVQGPMGWIVYVCREKFQSDFVARSFALVRPVFHRGS